MELRVSEVTDPIVRENFKLVQEAVEALPFAKGKWRFVEIEFTTAITGYKFAHGFNFIPKDVIQTSLTGAGALTWNYTSFSRDSVSITTTGPCVVRAFIGSYFERGSR